ncbi:nicotinate-nucleotide adenylyltransferase [Rhodocyclus tenuis]|uniref:Probable nicotinate-nucleotide adenylyltransferase n=2 Tax=Rhodocyclus TaxID=1064 RepID=A0A6L5K100_RHOTE|nr:nicotinate-nucleotide adenylyltransferase [Rhodocyclus gracilis]MQY52574.1 nicotinate-nucleotide adenylyltransferase [Rhodocyclus gracilis]MRD74018.1 nicotinate-nucleotide adenylyltransferase [Rhodocyclus gracilis]NJA89974.1 nicotinate-nucleotide adenylyltransferase [Rhodocyclus gracilis]
MPPISTSDSPATAGGVTGLFGGTFDPVHLGHLRLAEEAADRLGLSEVRWIPAGQPTHRETPSVNAQNRLAMVQLAIARNPRFTLDATEVASAQPSYTVPTLRRLRQEASGTGERPLVLLLGADAFAGLPDWRDWTDLFALAHIAIAHRPGFPIEPGNLPPALAEVFRARYRASPEVLREAPAGHIVSFAMTQLDISATQIRTLLRNARSARYLLPDAVIDYIRREHLYCKE